MRVSIESGVGGMDGTWEDEGSVNRVKGRMVYWYEDCIWVVEILWDGIQQLL